MAWYALISILSSILSLEIKLSLVGQSGFGLRSTPDISREIFKLELGSMVRFRANLLCNTKCIFYRDRPHQPIGFIKEKAFMSKLIYRLMISSLHNVNQSPLTKRILIALSTVCSSHFRGRDQPYCHISF